MDWIEIAAIVATIAALILGGKLRNLLVQVKELVDTIVCALEDQDVSPDEIKNILKEAKDVKIAATEVAASIGRAHRIS